MVQGPVFADIRAGMVCTAAMSVKILKHYIPRISDNNNRSVLRIVEMIIPASAQNADIL
jgi:hypothetical protein